MQAVALKKANDREAKHPLIKWTTNNRPNTNTNKTLMQNYSRPRSNNIFWAKKLPLHNGRKRSVWEEKPWRWSYSQQRRKGRGAWLAPPNQKKILKNIWITWEGGREAETQVNRNGMAQS